MSTDLTHAIQSKWHKPGASIPYTEISTFFTLGHMMGATRFTIVTSMNVTLNKICPRNVEHVIIEDREFIQILMDILRPPLVAALQPPLVDTHGANIPAPELVVVQEQKGQQLSDRTCDKCGTTFRYPSQLKPHQQRKTPCQAKIETPANARAICRHCNRGFNSNDSMNRHIRQSCKVATKNRELAQLAERMTPDVMRPQLPFETTDIVSQMAEIQHQMKQIVRHLQVESFH
jgi:hypothetical protein